MLLIMRSSPEVTDEGSENLIWKWSEVRKAKCRIVHGKIQQEVLVCEGHQRMFTLMPFTNKYLMLYFTMFVVGLKEALLFVEFMVHVFAVVVFEVPLQLYHLHREEGVLYKDIHEDGHKDVYMVVVGLM